MTIHRRELLRRLAFAAAALALPAPLPACARAAEDEAEAAGSPPGSDEDRARLARWVSVLRDARLADAQSSIGAAAARVGELAIGTPYEAFTLEAYLRAGGSPARTEPLALSLTRFDCVSLVEACLAIARVAHARPTNAWSAFAREMERMRYRDGVRGGYASRLHYFSEWIRDGERRALLTDLGQSLGAGPDRRPLRFMTANRGSYAGLADDAVFADVAAIERSLDAEPRWIVPPARIPAVENQLQSGDLVAFATNIPGLDVTHAAFAYRDAAGTLRVLHAPLSGGVVEVTGTTLEQYVAAIRRCTGILVARPRWGTPDRQAQAPY